MIIFLIFLNIERQRIIKCDIERQRRTDVVRGNKLRSRSTQKTMRSVAQRYRTSSCIIRLVVLETQAFMSEKYICI